MNIFNIHKHKFTNIISSIYSLSKSRRKNPSTLPPFKSIKIHPQNMEINYSSCEMSLYRNIEQSTQFKDHWKSNKPVITPSN